MKATQGQPFGRLAFRVEGENWNVYFAQTGTKEGAIYLGSVKVTLVTKTERRDQFIAFMRECFSDMTENVFGHRAEWGDPVNAPERERTKGSS